MTVFIDPNLPFSKPMQKGERSVVMFVTALVQAVLAVPLVMLVSRFIYSSAALTAAFIAGMVLLSAGVERLLAVRVTHRSARWEYIG
jgi:hypothetical protein